MSKFKKYLLLIPTVFLMLLNCMSFTAFAADADEETEFPVFLDPADYTPYDFTDVDTVLSGYSSSFDPSESYYFYCAYFTPEEYDNYINNRKSTLSLLFFTFELDFFSIENDSVYEAKYKNFANFSFTYDPTSSQFTPFLRTSAGTDLRFDYCKDNGSVTYSSSGYYSKPTTLTRESFTNSRYFVYQSTNLPNLELHENAINSGSGALNVSVNFDPEMSGDFQRKAVIDDKIVTLDTLNFSVTNNSKFSIQYLVAIVSQDDFFALYPDNNAFSHPNGKVYSGDPTYVYVSDEWCYLPSGSSKKSVTSTYCPSSWHYVDTGDVDKVTVKFNQMKLNIGVIYNVYVYAVKNTQDSVCVIPYNIDSYQYNQDYVLNFSEAQLVYSSQFTCSNPAEFDPNSNSGSYAFDGSDTSLFNRANGYIDENGNVVIDRIDTDTLISGSDSWGSSFDTNAWDVYYDKQNSVSSDLTQLSNNFSSFFRFVNKTFGYFPKNYQSVISLGLTSLVVLGIIKVVIK